MSPRDTGTGRVLEQMIVPALRSGKYSYQTQVIIGKRPGQGKHKVDAVASRQDGKTILISLKTQQTSGTAEQKVPYEVMSLIKALKEEPGKYGAAYIVLAGEGWKLKSFYVKEGLSSYLKDASMVKIVSLDTFVDLAYHRKL